MARKVVFDLNEKIIQEIGVGSTPLFSFSGLDIL